MKNGAFHVSGFSLLEVMIAILVLGIALVGLTQGITTALGSGRESEQQATAALFAAGQIEKLRADTGLKDEETEGDCESLPKYRWKQTVTAAGVDGLHEVAVVVEDAKSGQPIYELRTLLFERPTESTPTNSDKKKSSQGSQGSQGSQRSGGAR